MTPTTRSDRIRALSFDERLDKYMKIAYWLRDRYTNNEGQLTLSVGDIPSPYSKLEQLAAERYLLV